MTELCIVAYMAINVVVYIIIMANCADGANLSFVNPIVIYKNIKVNWFGAVLLTVIANLLFPTVSIPYWIYKICTVGRKDDE